MTQLEIAKWLGISIIRVQSCDLSTKKTEIRQRLDRRDERKILRQVMSECSLKRLRFT